MAEIILIVVGILIIATLFDKWQKSKNENPESRSKKKLNTQESYSKSTGIESKNNNSNFLVKEIQLMEKSMSPESHDTEYKLYKAILYATKLVADRSEFKFDEKQIFELVLFFYSYAFENLYESVPEKNNLIWMEVQSNVYMQVLEYGEKYGLKDELSMDIGDFINQRAELFSNEINIIRTNNDLIPTRLINCVFENPLNSDPIESKDLTRYLKFRTLLNEPFSLLDAITKKIINIDLNFGKELKYEEFFKEFSKDNPNINLAHFKPLILNEEECKKIYHSSYISGSFPKGREFYEAVKSLNTLKEASKEVVLACALILFDKWINSYREKYGFDSISKERLLLIEHQIVQTKLRYQNA